MKLENGNLRDTIVVANPGTGKTWEIVDTVIALLREKVPGDEILCVTFTNKASDEMRSRILKALKNEPELRSEGLRISVSTVHSHAVRMLESRGKPVNLASNTVLRYLTFKKFKELGTFTYQEDYLLNTVTPKVENAIRYLKSFGITPDGINQERVIELVCRSPDFLKNKNLDEAQFRRLINDFLQVFRFYEDFKSGSNLMDYNDILTQFLEINDARKYAYVLVDEFQDLNMIQAKIAQVLGNTRIFVGDRKQSIFGFQGGSLGSFNGYLQNTDFRKMSKSSNYRSTDNILSYAKSYFLARSAESSYEDELKELHSQDHITGEKVSLFITENPERASCDILRQSMEAHKGEKRDYAIIARTNQQISKISTYLYDLKIQHSSTMPQNASFDAASEIIAFLKGLFSSDPAIVSRAILTPFSGLTMMEATALFREVKTRKDFLDILPANLKKYRSIPRGYDLINSVLHELVLPLSVAMGNDYYTSARSISLASREFFDIFHEFSVEDYFNYLNFASSEDETDLIRSEVNLLTVHKAKGLEFDEVIYVPSSPPGSLGFFDSMTSGIIKQVTGLDVNEDLSEEPLRIDFVAITRPKQKLSIVIKEKLRDEFLARPDLCDQFEIQTDQVTHSRRKFDDAYMLFLSGRSDGAKEVLESSKKWLATKISGYFGSLNSLSYSLLNNLKDPLRFLQQNILGLSQWTEASRFGTIFHELASGYSEGTISEEQIPPDHVPDFQNFKAVLEEIGQNYEVPAKYNEYDISMPLSELFDGMESSRDITIKAKLDAVYTSSSGDRFLVVDYKTSREEDGSYWHQLWLYTRMIQKYLDIPPGSISGGMAYVNLRGRIDVGNSRRLEIREYEKLVRKEIVKERIATVLEYIGKPELFMDAVLTCRPADELQARLLASLRDVYNM